MEVVLRRLADRKRAKTPARRLKHQILAGLTAEQDGGPVAADHLELV
jgi:hypothetical protein